jgi:hypothetical protein
MNAGSLGDPRSRDALLVHDHVSAHQKRDVATEGSRQDLLAKACLDDRRIVTQ